MLLGNLLRSEKKKYSKLNAKGLSFDSRTISKGDIFFAINGNRTSGNKFVKEAIKKGASAIVTDKKIKQRGRKIPLILVKDVRKHLAEVCSKFYKEKPTNIIAVTGTNGKSSVADFFYQILTLYNIPAASVGTLGVISKRYRTYFTCPSVIT